MALEEAELFSWALEAALWRWEQRGKLYYGAGGEVVCGYLSYQRGVGWWTGATVEEPLGGQALHQSRSVQTEVPAPGRQESNRRQEGQAVAGAVWISRLLGPRANRCNKSRGAESTCRSCCLLLCGVICPMACRLESGPKELQRHWYWELFAFCRHCLLQPVPLL